MSDKTKEMIRALKDKISTLSTHFSCVEEAHEAWAISPKDYSTPKGLKQKSITLMAVTHGNEVCGIDILLRFLCKIENSPELLQTKIGIILGNTAASLKDVRFIERDLNRSFLSSQHKLLEEKRAQTLEPLLAETQIFLDFHQTIQPSQRPFFIFPHTKQGYSLARLIKPEMTIVTHFGAKFSKDGMCTDDFVNQQAGVGISIETGGKGFFDDQSELGLDICLNSLQIAQENHGKKELTPRPSGPTDGPIFTWSWTEDYPSEYTELRDGLENFEKIEKGDFIGKTSLRTITAPESGYMMFPKYTQPNTDKNKPSELYRLIKEIKATELPT